MTERGKRLLSGIERADSVGLDPHKWLFQPYEVGGLLVKDARTLEQAFAVHHDVLQDTVWGANHPNISDRGLQLSRSFRALKVRLGEKRRRRRRFSGARSSGSPPTPALWSYHVPCPTCTTSDPFDP